MRRKMLIVITLVAIMLLNCILPVVEVQAVTARTEMTFNATLYKGLKSYFQEVGINALYNDVTYTIKMENSILESIKELSLKEKGIDDLTGLDVFTNVESLILSSNYLSEDSNLGVLNNFPKLTYLDLSSNEITDVSVIEDLINRLIGISSNSINISNQVANIVTDVMISADDEETTIKYALPQILQIAGEAKDKTIKEKGKLKAAWIDVTKNTPSNVNQPLFPYANKATIPTAVTSTNNEFELVVGSDVGGYTAYQGLATIEIRISSATNILKDSIFKLYYVVHKEGTQAVIFKDNNLYTAVRDQLTARQLINTDLLSYPFAVNTDGSVYYDVCDYTVSGDRTLLKINGVTVYYITGFDTANPVLHLADGTVYDVEYQNTFVPTTDSNGVVTVTRKIKVPHYNADCRNLYIDRYNEPKALVISDADIINKITSLILNDQQISDLSGIESFVGLESNLNVSYNYIDTLGKIYALQINKDNNNSNLQSAFSAKKSAMNNTKGNVITAYNNIVKTVKDIEAQIKIISDSKKVIIGGDASTDDYKKAVSALEGAAKQIGYDGTGTAVEGSLLENLEKYLTDSKVGLNPYISTLYSRLGSMYDVFNKEYKLTTIVIPELNYQTETEYEIYKETIKTKDGAMGLVKSQASRVASYEQAGALSQMESSMIVSAFGLSLSSEEENPISVALNDLIKTYEEENAPRTTWTEMLNKFIEINLYSQAANYCLLERMNNDFAEGECGVENYFIDLIEDYNYEGIDTSVAEGIYNKYVSGTTTGTVTTRLYTIFQQYMEAYRTCETINQFACSGPYRNVQLLDYSSTPETIPYKVAQQSTEGGTTTTTYVDKTVSTINEIHLIEVLYDITRTYKNNLDVYFFEQLIALANKFTVVDETSRYVVLPNLKRVDVSSNAIDTIGDIKFYMVGRDGNKTEHTENLSVLKNLKEFYMAHNLVSGNIYDKEFWTQLNSLKKLDLSYNFISDISPLEVLTNLRYLNVSDNLLSGEFNISLQKMTKLHDLILAGNRYTDISSILNDYEMVANGNFTEYFAREDTLNLDLSRQELTIDIEKPIAYDPNVSVLAIDMPKIIGQLEEIDATRTAYGITSTKGTITAKGGVAYIPVGTVGDYTGVVKVIAANGYPEDVTTSVGIDTTVTINYSVKDIKVTGIKITPEELTKVERGTTVNLTAEVEGTNVDNKAVEWSITGAQSEGTTITSDGVLTVDANETATNITVTVMSTYDDTKEATKDLEVFTKEVTAVKINEENARVEKGTTSQFTATVEGSGLEETEQKVNWSVSGNESSGTTIDENGVLTVAKDETVNEITVTATSEFDNSKSASTQVELFIKTVNAITVHDTVKAKPGTQVQFTAEVEGDNLEENDKGVTWSVIGNNKAHTIINSVTGMLTIDPEETADTLVVVAKSKFNEEIIGTADVNLVVVKNLTLSSEDGQVSPGGSKQFVATVEGVNLTDDEKQVTWSITGNASDLTMISTSGVLKVASNETSKEIIVTATSKENTKVSSSMKVAINVSGITLGYKVSSDGTEILGISPNTKATNFKSKLVNDSSYVVEVKRNGDTVSDSNYVATSDIVVIKKDGQLVGTYELVVKGDVNGDGVADALDSSLIKAHRAKIEILSGTFLEAADINNDGYVDIIDVRLLLYHRARIEGYIL